MNKEITQIFGNRLKQLRIENNYTMDELTDLYNEKFDAKLNKGAISRYENNLQEPKFTTAYNFSKIFNVSIDWLMGKNVPKNLAINQPDYIRVPVVGVIRAGDPILAQQNIIEYINIPESMSKGKDVFGLKIVGDSMNNARIYEGDTVVVEKQCEVENGEIAVVLIDGENATVKRFYKTGTTVTLVPESSNPIHKPRVIDIKKIKVQVLGKVIGALIKF